MVIILCLYVVALWLMFSKFKLVRRNDCDSDRRRSGAADALGGVVHR